MTDNVHQLIPCNDFNNVLESAKDELESGLVVGYDSNGIMKVYGGGLINGKQPVAKDFLWLAATFQQKILNGDYSE